LNQGIKPRHSSTGKSSLFSRNKNTTERLENPVLELENGTMLYQAS